VADPDDITVGAAPHNGLWKGYIYFDGKVQMFEVRSTRDVALADARAAKERLLRPQLPSKIWRRG
jgi:hypothetical protein